ncbi:MAG: hypothetical protein E6I92_03745 [Chloroflexi bacterium]|nr:MAG: hypothetical protein E6I92_03745 [Chloroflexota bacterium]
MKPTGRLAAALGQAIVPVLVAAGGAILLAGCTSCQSTVRTTAMTVIAGGSYDVVVADQPGQRLYLADRTAKGVDVVDISSPQPVFVSTIPLTAAPHGLALDTASHRLFAALGNGAVAVIDTGPRSSNQVVANIQVDSSSLDLIDYSAQTDSLYVGSDRTVLVVDAARAQVTKRITTAMAVGQPRFDPADGMVYATVSGTDSLVQINPATGFVTRSYVIAKCRPNGVGINPARQLALVSCGGSIALVNLESGAQRVTRVVQGGDVVTYEAAADRFVVASPHDMDESAIGVFAGDGSFIGSVPATSSAHAAAFDSAHGLVYAPGPVGLMSFAPAACAPPPDWLRFVGGLSVFAVPLLLAALFLVLVARALARRRAGLGGPTYEELQAEDLEFERERMRALEDGILGPRVAD